MDQNRPNERVTVEKILRLAAQLSPAELQELRRKLSKTWGDRFRQLVEDVANENEGDVLVSEEEIANEVTQYRRKKRVQGD